MTFTQDWIHNKDIIPHWERLLSHLKGSDLNMLEVGCFEGMSTVWFLENILTSDNSKITVVDTFEGDSQTKEIAKTLDGTRYRFLENTKRFRNKIRLLIATSNDMLPKIYDSFDLIYIDGSHLAEDVLSDMVLSFRLLKKGGIMIMDDYEMWYKDKDNVIYEPAIAINAFVSCYANKIHRLHVGWQYIFQKV